MVCCCKTLVELICGALLQFQQAERQRQFCAPPLPRRQDAKGHCSTKSGSCCCRRGGERLERTRGGPGDRTWCREQRIWPRNADHGTRGSLKASAHRRTHSWCACLRVLSAATCYSQPRVSCSFCDSAAEQQTLTISLVDCPDFHPQSGEYLVTRIRVGLANNCALPLEEYPVFDTTKVRGRFPARAVLACRQKRTGTVRSRYSSQCLCVSFGLRSPVQTGGATVIRIS